MDGWCAFWGSVEKGSRRDRVALWRNRPPLFDDMVTYLRPVPRLPCEGEHFLAKELYKKFRELDAIIKNTTTKSEER
jgi:hypothetical protein